MTKLESLVDHTRIMPCTEVSQEAHPVFTRFQRSMLFLLTLCTYFAAIVVSDPKATKNFLDLAMLDGLSCVPNIMQEHLCLGNRTEDGEY